MVLLLQKQRKIQSSEDWSPGLSAGFRGEPFEPSNQQALLPLLRKVRKSYPEKTIWCYTGYDFEQDLLTGRLCDWPVTEEMLSYIDVLVDGEFKLDLKNPNLRFRGSSNQRVIDLKKSLYRYMVMNWFYGQKLIKIKTPSTYNNMGGVFCMIS